MKAAPLLVAWHNEKAPIYSAQFDPNGQGRLATAGGDNNIRLWKIEHAGEERKITYLSTLQKHTQAVNVVRWSPKGDLLASAGDDGNVLLWVPSELRTQGNMTEDDVEDKETWIVKRMCRSNSGFEIYDLAWSPDGSFFITGSMDNVARVFDAQSGNIVRQIAEHNNYVQGVAWDPLNEFIATQSSDRSVHIYKLRTNDGTFTLSQHSKMAKMDLLHRRTSSNSPAPPDFGHRASLSIADIPNSNASPIPSTPGTPTSIPLPMNPPPPASFHSRRTSRETGSPSLRRSPSPAPSLPLPAVMPSASPNPLVGVGAKSANIYANETLTSFFRRLTFAPDGSLLFTPAGQYKTSNPNPSESSKPSDDTVNTVYIYSRAGLNKPPVAHLPGHKKPSIAVKCSPVYYNLRLPAPTKQITIDTSAPSTDDMTPLPEPILASKPRSVSNSMDPPPPLSGLASPTNTTAPSPTSRESESKNLVDGPSPAFVLPYRIVYAVATQDAVLIYDTQQQTPLCVVSNLHFATFTDLTWSNDGNTLLMTSTDGFCSYLSFAPGELGKIYHGSLSSRASHHPAVINTSTSAQSTPLPTPTATSASIPTMIKHPSSAGFATSPSPGFTPGQRPISPTRSNSASSVATQSSVAPTPLGAGMIVSNPTPSVSNLPTVAAGGTAGPTGPSPPVMASPTPPMTPAPIPGPGASTSQPSGASFASSTSQSLNASGKREWEATKEEKEETGGEGDKQPKKRRVVPTLVRGESSGGGAGSGQ